MSDRPGGHDAPRLVLIAVVVMAAVIAGSLLILRVDLEHRGEGGPPPAFVVTYTPATFGPPPGH